MKNDLILKISASLDAFDRGEVKPRTDLDKIARELASLLRVPLYPEPTREYVRSDGLAVRYTANGQSVPLALDAPVFVLHIRFSWISPYVMLDWKSTEDGRQWTTLDNDALPNALGNISAKIRHFLDQNGNRVLSGPILDEIIPGRASELDELDLRVREALFSAID